MREWRKRGLALALALALTLCLLPRWMTDAADLDAEKFEALSDLETKDIGKCIPVKVGNKVVMNACVYSDALPTRYFSAKKDDSTLTVLNRDGKVTLNSALFNEGEFDTDIDAYNMIRNFGSCNANGSESKDAQPGFSVKAEGDAKGHLYVNNGSTEDNSRKGQPLSISLGRKDSDDDYGTVKAQIVIRDNPTLKSIAEGGHLQVYFSGMVCGARQSRAGKDDHTVVQAGIYVDYYESDSNGFTYYSKKVQTDSGDHHTKGLDTGGWITLSPMDRIRIQCSFWEDSDNLTNGSADVPTGIAEAVLLFRDVSAPQISAIEMNVEGDYHEKGSGSTYREEILLNKESSINLNIAFDKPVKSALPKGVDNDLLLGQLAKHRMFVNTPDTGFKNMGEPVYFSLNAAKHNKGTEDEKDDVSTAVSMTDENSQKTALRSAFTSLSYLWAGKESNGSTSGAYYGNNPTPNGADWIIYSGQYEGQDSIKEGKNNAYAFLNKLILASLHDEAGNPLSIKSGPTQTSDAYSLGTARTSQITDTNQLAKLKTELTVQRSGGAEQKTDSCINPFQKYDFIIDAIPPTYSVTSNEVQPDVLTNLALTRGDSFDLVVNFSEGVQARLFDDNGKALNFLAGDTQLQFKPGSGTDAITATYKEGGGTEKWRFSVTIPEGTKYDVTTLDIAKVIQKDSTLEYVLTDYVGNPLEPYSVTHPNKTGAGAAPPMDWARLKVDNTAPTIAIALSAGDFKITATDPTNNGSASGVFSPPTATNGQSMLYYAWVKSDEKDKALEALTAENYAAVKRFSLVGGSSGDYQIIALNNGGVAPLPAQEGEWVLLAFAADKTWDTARQILQYDEYKTVIATEEGATTYYKEFLKQAGVDISSESAVTYELIETKPDDWETAYEKYYTQSDGKYQILSRGESYPAWNDKGLYYRQDYVALTEDPTKNTSNAWKDVYTDYYEKVDDKYQHIPKQNDWPDYAQGTYFTDYNLLTDENAPTDWESANVISYSKTRDDNGNVIYSPINTSGVPDFATETAYSVTAEAVTIPTQKAQTDETGNPVTDDTGNTVMEDIEKPLEEYLADANNSGVELYFKETNDANETVYRKIYTSHEKALPEYDSTKTYYKLTVAQLTTAPSDWNANYRGYFVLTPETFGSVAGVAPTWKANTYYQESEGSYTLTTAQPADWSAKYSSYFTPTSVTGDTAPEWTPSAYWSKSGDAYALTTEKPSDWDTKYSDYFEMTAVKGAAPGWDTSKKYYLLGGYDPDFTYTLTTAQPADWATNYTQYVTWEAAEAYTPVQEADKVSYAANAYYRKASGAGGYDVLPAEPSDWKTNYQDYYQKNGNTYEHVPEVKIEFQADKYYEVAYVKVASEPADWRTVCRDGTYYLYVGETTYKEDTMTWGSFLSMASIPRSQIGVTSIGNANIELYSAPAWESGKYYSANLSIKQLLNSFSTSTDAERKRKNEFEQSMIAAPNNKSRMEIIAKYSEFSGSLEKADREMLRQSAQYEKWAYDKFKKDDSNWTYATSDTQDKTPPSIVGTVSGSGSNLVTANVKVSDTIAGAVGGLKDKSTLKYTFVQKGQKPDEGLWEAVSEATGDASAYSFTLSSDDFQKNHPLANGEYDLYVKAEDKAGNVAETLVASVTLDSGAQISYRMFLREGEQETEVQPEDNFTDKARKEVNLSVSFAGKVDGSNLFDRDFKLYSALTQGVEPPTDEAQWQAVTEKSQLTGDSQLDGMTTYRYTLNPLTAESGTWYLHLRYDYVRGEATESGGISKAFLFNTISPELTWNITQSGGDSISVQVTADLHNNGEGASSYQWVSGVQTTQPDDASGWKSTTLPATLTLGADDPVATTGKVTLWVRVSDSLGNETVDKQSYQFANAQTEDVPPPEPESILLDVQKDENGVSYAVARLTIRDGGQETPPAMGSEYSYALTRGGTQEAWSRWIPYENMVRVEIGSEGSVADKLQFKFRSASGAITAEEDYLTLEIPSDFTDSKPWAVVTRSTFQTVSATKGLSLRFAASENTRVLKNGTPIQTDTIKDSDVFSYTVENTATQQQDTLYVSVNNVLTTMPIVWGLEFSQTERTASSVLASLKLQDGVSVTGIEFTPKDGGESRQSQGSAQYMFRENGTAVFALRNVIGETAEASATVGWIDNTPPVLTLTPDYSKFKRFKDANGKTVAAGAILVLTSSKPVRLTSYGGEILDKSDSEYRTSFSVAIWENDTYSFSVVDELGNAASQSIAMYNLITEIPEPTVSVTLTEERDRADVTIRGSVSELAQLFIPAYELYSGGTSGEKVTLDNGSYVITRSYSENCTLKRQFSDNLGNQVSYTISISGIDTRPPTLKVTGAPFLVTGDDAESIDWRDYVTVSDDFTSSERIYLEALLDDGSPLNSYKTGANRVIVTAIDRCGNYTEESAWLYSLPPDCMIVADENGVLFMATAKDIALVRDDEIELTVRDYQLMDYNGKTVRNAAGTYDIYIQKGLLREGQLKYLQTVKLSDNGVDATHKVTIHPSELEGTGWYTIIVRNSERYREYVSFFISTTLVS